MVELESIFRHKSPNGEKLISNGFAYSKRGYSKTFAVLCGQFHVRVRVSKKENVDFRVYEAESGEGIRSGACAGRGGKLCGQSARGVRRGARRRFRRLL